MSAARFILNSSECIKSELDLFHIPPTNTSIESGGWSQHQPIAIIENGPTKSRDTKQVYRQDRQQRENRVLSSHTGWQNGGCFST